MATLDKEPLFAQGLRKFSLNARGFAARDIAQVRWRSR
jgi:hypothetical protein